MTEAVAPEPQQSPAISPVIYEAVAARRLQWDNLLWQVPLLGLTAQAFLFTIALGADSRPTARLFAAALSLVVTFLCITLMARHRQAELSDSHWLEDYDRDVSNLPTSAFGEQFRDRRNSTAIDSGWKVLDRLTPMLPGYRTWVIGLLLFGLAAVGVIVVTFTSPAWLEKKSDPPVVLIQPK